jgi:hypothetical protein
MIHTVLRSQIEVTNSGQVQLYEESFRDVTPCSPLKINRRFGDTTCIFTVEE